MLLVPAHEEPANRLLGAGWLAERPVNAFRAMRAEGGMAKDDQYEASRDNDSAAAADLDRRDVLLASATLDGAFLLYG